LRAAPSYRSDGAHLTPVQVVRQVLAGLGDRRYIHRIALGSPPPLTLERLKGWYSGARPPSDALWAYIAAPEAVASLPAHASATAIRTSEIAQWETSLVEGALRDGFCNAGGRPLVGFSVSGTTEGVSDHGQALGQRFLVVDVQHGAKASSVGYYDPL
jgi:hypothetical protein